MNQFIVVFLPLSDCHFVMKVFAKNNALRACLHRGGIPQIGEVKCGGSPHLSCKRDQLKTSDYMDRRLTPPKRFTSFPGRFSFEKFLRKKALEMRLGEGAAGSGPRALP